MLAQPVLCLIEQLDTDPSHHCQIRGLSGLKSSTDNMRMCHGDNHFKMFTFCHIDEELSFRPTNTQ